MSADFVKHDLGYVPAGSTVRIELSHRANVHLLNEHNFHRYRAGMDFRSIGGEAVRSPVLLRPPESGHWYVVLDLGGRAGSIESYVEVVPRAA